MDVSDSTMQILDAMPGAERELVRAILSGTGDLDHELAVMRLRNISAKYRERYKRSRMRRGGADEPVSASELRARLDLLEWATAVCETALHDPGSPIRGD